MNNVKDIISYIEDEMDFYSYNDFYVNARELKNMYVNIDIRTKKLYKWYVYSREISTNQKNRIWEYLNGDLSLGDLMYYEKDGKKNHKKIRR